MLKINPTHYHAYYLNTYLVLQYALISEIIRNEDVLVSKNLEFNLDIKYDTTEGSDEIQITDSAEVVKYTALELNTLISNLYHYYHMDQYNLRTFDAVSWSFNFLENIKLFNGGVFFEVNNRQNLFQNLSNVILFKIGISPSIVIKSFFFKKYHKLKKSIYKKHYIKKIRSIRKFKNIFKSKLYRLNNLIYNFNFTYVIKREYDTPIKILTQRITLTKRVVEDSNLHYFFKFNKNYENHYQDLIKSANSNTSKFSINEDFTLFLRNFHKKPYNKLRLARLVHWGFFFKKTIKKQKYKKFINPYIKKSHTKYLDQLFIFCYFLNCKISPTRLNRITKQLTSLVTTQLSAKIISLPIISNQYISWSFFKKKNSKLKHKLGKWSFLNFKKFLYPWLQKKKNFPKIVEHIQPKFLYLSQLMQLDPSTNYLYLTKKLNKFFTPISENLKLNFYLKLHMFRYKANK